MTGEGVVRADEVPEPVERSAARMRDQWPGFVLRGEVPARYRERAVRYFGEFALVVVDGGEAVADGRGVPLRWDGRPERLPAGYDGALAASVEGRERGEKADTLCVMSATVRGDRAGRGLAGVLLTALRERAAAAGLARVIVPVRPPTKAYSPRTDMAEFAERRRPDGLHPDPWIRTHQRLGAVVLGPAPRSMVVTADVEHWERWTGMTFPVSGEYEVPGALDPVMIDRERDLGRYAETNVWMRHS
ncbi:hypothetical protein [Streptantibioticus silvisoli]|uniref:GNAT family N-acetyltransferase n=1 Tax=Streptantibioticus silvisoli TaxID=2705255 RepID=A0ABT6VRN2_9ACTN|nr:hypothetical protein [Streptantibioticus silvisoli]MDI5961148.1 hypothetical protein [Streptantibioticus silvisoli]